jgi:hypothetical protein
MWATRITLLLCWAFVGAASAQDYIVGTYRPAAAVAPPAGIAFVASEQSSGSGVTVSVTLRSGGDPAIAAGEMILLFVSPEGSQTISAGPSGYTFVDSTANTTWNQHLYAKIATGAEADTIALTFSGTATWDATVLRFSGTRQSVVSGIVSSDGSYGFTGASTIDSPSLSNTWSPPDNVNVLTARVPTININDKPGGGFTVAASSLPTDGIAAAYSINVSASLDWGNWTLPSSAINRNAMSVMVRGPDYDFTADADCVAAWDFTSTGPTDLCDSGNSDDLTLNGTGSTHATVGGLGSWRSGSSGAYYRAANSTDFDDTEGDVDVTLACLLQEPDAAGWEDYDGIIHREDGVNLLAFDRSSTEVVVVSDGTIEHVIPNSFSGSHSLNVWHLYGYRRTAASDELLGWWIDGSDGSAVETVSTGAVTLATMPSISSPLDIGRQWETDFGGIATPVDAIFAQCAIFSRLLTNDELCELAAYGVTGADFDRSGTITCVP